MDANRQLSYRAFSAWANCLKLLTILAAQSKLINITQSGRQ
jgi:hypothetical protein